MATLIPRCTWRACRAPAVWRITAGTPGPAGTPGHAGYAACLACHQHRQPLAHRTSARAGAPAHAERLPDQPAPPTPTGDLEQLAIDL